MDVQIIKDKNDQRQKVVFSSNPSAFIMKLEHLHVLANPQSTLRTERPVA